ncbi:MAG: hypothetical protein ACMXYD_01095 [Candidatus Woesearchaeota archaeon]
MEDLLVGIGLGAIGLAAMLVLLLLALAVYIYTSWAIMTIAKKTKTTPAWLAWIPIANMFLLAKIAKTPWWTALIAILTGWIPFVGQFVLAGIIIYWFWLIAERRKYDGWMGILMIIPIVNLVILGVLAFADKKK